jgi:hypothetical protein
MILQKDDILPHHYMVSQPRTWLEFPSLWKPIISLQDTNCVLCWGSFAFSLYSHMLGFQIPSHQLSLLQKRHWHRELQWICCHSDHSWTDKWVHSQDMLLCHTTHIFAACCLYSQKDDLLNNLRRVGNSVQWLGYGLDNWSSIPNRGKEGFLFVTVSRQVLGPIQPPIQ